jgi:hypothetical protein
MIVAYFLFFYKVWANYILKHECLYDARVGKEEHGWLRDAYLFDRNIHEKKDVMQTLCLTLNI